VAVAYDGRTPVFRARYSSGRPSWETSSGRFPVIRRVEKETMDSATLLGMDADRANYRVEDIKWTQYFTDDGQAIHHNYWRDPALFGIPSSHGCLGMLESDAKWFWDWTTIGTPLVNHNEAG
jgi:lipoprotein-anchoring transpeptidase ErfK/SrfK